MATTTTTTTTVDVQNAPRRNGRLIKPNVPPDDLEVSPDPKWRDFRLREVRPELCEPYPATFPDLSHILYRNDAIAANQYQQENIGSRPRHFTTRSIDDIRDYKPERLQFKTIEEIQARVARIKMQTHPRRLERPEDNDSLPPFFYEETCSSLFSRVWDFANDTFGHKCFAGQLQDKDWTLHLLRNLPADFVRCASVVARGDPARGAKALTDEHGYEFMFLSKHQRVYLCTAVVSKLLQENCFDSLLFGTTKLERKTLNLIDRTTDNFSDGYYRKFNRRGIAAGYLKVNLETQNFWRDVDRVATGILVLFLPLINMLGSMDEQSPGVKAPWPPLQVVHQKLHSIVAEAAWLNNANQVSRSAMWIEFPQPGQLWDLRQQHATDTTWQASNAAAIAQDDELPEYRDSEAVVEWRGARDAAYTRYKAGLQALTPVPRDQWSAQYYEPTYPKPRHPIRRTAKVQIAMWPFFERYFPRSQDTANGGIVNDGEIINTVKKAEVVYYAGKDADDAEQWEDYSLQQHLDDWEQRNKGLLTRLYNSVDSFFGRSGRAGPRAPMESAQSDISQTRALATNDRPATNDNATRDPPSQAPGTGNAPSANHNPVPNNDATQTPPSQAPEMGNAPQTPEKTPTRGNNQPPARRSNPQGPARSNTGTSASTQNSGRAWAFPDWRAHLAWLVRTCLAWLWLSFLYFVGLLVAAWAYLFLINHALPFIQSQSDDLGSLFAPGNDTTHASSIMQIEDPPIRTQTNVAVISFDGTKIMTINVPSHTDKSDTGAVDSPKDQTTTLEWIQKKLPIWTSGSLESSPRSLDEFKDTNDPMDLVDRLTEHVKNGYNSGTPDAALQIVSQIMENLGSFWENSIVQLEPDHSLFELLRHFLKEDAQLNTGYTMFLEQRHPNNVDEHKVHSFWVAYEAHKGGLPATKSMIALSQVAWQLPRTEKELAEAAVRLRDVLEFWNRYKRTLGGVKNSGPPVTTPPEGTLPKSDDHPFSKPPQPVKPTEADDEIPAPTDWSRAAEDASNQDHDNEHDELKASEGITDRADKDRKNRLRPGDWWFLLGRTLKGPIKDESQKAEDKTNQKDDLDDKQDNRDDKKDGSDDTKHDLDEDLDGPISIWITTKVIGVDYICKVDGEDATCYQTITVVTEGSATETVTPTTTVTVTVDV